MGKLEGKVALITGAGRGHAAAITKRFAAEGAKVSICDIIPVEMLENKIGSKIKAKGGKIICFQTDVSIENQVNSMVKKTMEIFGAIDILANVVGIAGPTNDIWNMTLEEWKKTLEVNLDSLFLSCKAVIPEMIRKREGRIINFSSGTGKQPLSHRAPYATSKMGVIGFTRTLAADVGRYNITVNAICPGGHEARSLELSKSRAEYLKKPFDKTTMLRKFSQSDPRRTLAGRWCTDEGFSDKGAGIENTASLALFLASKDSASMTGQDINCSGEVMW